MPLTGGVEMSLRFAIWDSGDGGNDSTVFIDGFAFSTAAVAAITTVPRDSTIGAASFSHSRAAAGM